MNLQIISEQKTKLQKYLPRLINIVDSTSEADYILFHLVPDAESYTLLFNLGVVASTQPDKLLVYADSVDDLVDCQEIIEVLKGLKIPVFTHPVWIQEFFYNPEHTTVFSASVESVPDSTLPLSDILNDCYDVVDSNYDIIISTGKLCDMICPLDYHDLAILNLTRKVALARYDSQECKATAYWSRFIEQNQKLFAQNAYAPELLYEGDKDKFVLAWLREFSYLFESR